MTSERWRQIESVFHRAAAHAAPDRDAFLREACAGDETLRQEVEVLLAAHEGAQNFQKTPAALFGDAISTNEKPDPPRERIGRYRGPVRSAVDELVPSFPDPEYHFYCSLMLAHVGDGDRAVEILAGAVDHGFFPVDTFTRHAWLASLRSRPDFLAILRTAARRYGEARAAFVAAGGETLLGLGDT